MPRYLPDSVPLPILYRVSRPQYVAQNMELTLVGIFRITSQSKSVLNTREYLIVKDLLVGL
jgi:hypothetical protein